MVKVGVSTPSPCHRVVSLDNKPYLILSLSTQVCKMVTGDILQQYLGDNLSVASCDRNWVKLRPCGSVWLVCNFNFLPYRQACSPICTKILDSALTNFQLKLKEAMHTSWEKPDPNQKVNHTNLTLTLWYFCILIS